MKVIEWLDEIKEARKREKDFREDGEDILEIYNAEKKTPFNILYSNTEVLLPALFSEVPRPVVTRRYKDEDPLGRYVSEAAQRMLEYLVDTDIDGYDKYPDAIQSATLDGLLPGRGVTSVKYESEDDWETVCTDSRKWDRVYFGYATKWAKVPWVCYEEYLDKEEAKEKFPDKVKYLKFVENEEDENKEEEEKNQGNRKTTMVYQVWDKESKKVLWISPQYKEGFLREDEDPLNLTGFFNCPEPLRFIEKSNDLMPTALYTQYENQASELNRIQLRLNKVIEAIKVRGCYNGALGEEIEQILKEQDNALVPTDKAAMLAEGGLDQNIWFLPIAELVATAQQLIQARESAKQVIYEITGISDIVRGQSMASETLGAQKIKEQWGTMRLKRLQKEVQRYALDTMRLMLDIAVEKFSEKAWIRMTGLPYSSKTELEQAQALMQAVQFEAQLNPQVMQSPAVQQAQQVLQKPKWPEILKVLKDNYSRSYKIDIETNSTLDVEATEDKQLVGDFMNAMAQFMNGIAPMTADGTLPFGAAKSMLLAIVKRYRFGREVEDEINAMQEPQPQQNPEMEKAAKDLQSEQEKFAQEKQQAEQKFFEEQNKLKMEKMQLDFDKKLAQMQLKFQEDLAKARQQVDQGKAESALKSLIESHKSNIQSMMDKHASSVQNQITKHSAEMEKRNELDKAKEEKDSEPKVIKLIRKDGEIVGATVGGKKINLDRQNGEITGASVG